jgi:hypothetical protein
LLSWAPQKVTLQKGPVLGRMSITTLSACLPPPCQPRLAPCLWAATHSLQ